MNVKEQGKTGQGRAGQDDVNGGVQTYCGQDVKGSVDAYKMPTTKGCDWEDGSRCRAAAMGLAVRSSDRLWLEKRLVALDFRVARHSSPVPNLVTAEV